MTEIQSRNEVKTAKGNWQIQDTLAKGYSIFICVKSWLWDHVFEEDWKLFQQCVVQACWKQ